MDYLIVFVLGAVAGGAAGMVLMAMLLATREEYEKTHTYR